MFLKEAGACDAGVRDVTSVTWHDVTWHWHKCALHDISPTTFDFAFPHCRVHTSGAAVWRFRIHTSSHNMQPWPKTMNVFLLWP